MKTVSNHNARNPDESILRLNYGAVDPSLTNDKCSFWRFRSSFVKAGGKGVKYDVERTGCRPYRGKRHRAADHVQDGTALTALRIAQD